MKQDFEDELHAVYMAKIQGLESRLAKLDLILKEGKYWLENADVSDPIDQPLARAIKAALKE